jgi:hypothetical protein
VNQTPSPPWSRLALASLAQGLAATAAAGAWFHGAAVLHQPFLPAGILSALHGFGAVATGIWALRRMSRQPELRGRGLAIAGIVLGAAPLVTLF